MSRDIRRMRPMGIADILDETVELYKTSFVLLVGIAAVMHVPYSLLLRYFLGRFTSLTAHPTAGAIPSMTEIFVLLGAMCVGAVYYIVVAPFVTGALTFAISERYLGRKVTIMESFKRVFNISVFWQLLVASIIQVAALAVPISVVYAAGVFAFIAIMAAHAGTAVMVVVVALFSIFGLGAVFGGLYLALRLTMTAISIVVESKGLRHALSRTWTLMPGSLLKCFVLVVLASLVSSLVSYAVTMPTQTLLVSSAPSQIALILNAVIGAISDTVFAPALSIVTILLYYDIRVRKEGFDLELLASELDVNRTADAWTAGQLPQEQVRVEEDDPTGPQ